MQKAILLAAGLFFSLHTPLAPAQGSFPSKPLRMLVGFEPGASTDIQTRLVAAKLGETIGQSVLVENRPGADGAIAAAVVAKSAPDGYTLFFISAGHAINPNFQELPYHPLNDFSPVVHTTSAPFFLVVHPSVPAQNVAEFIAYVKARPGQLSYGSSGAGGSLMMGMELFLSMAGIRITHVPYKGGAPATTDLIAGRIQAMVNNAASSLSNVRAGKLKMLGATSAQRTPIAPDVPAIAETVPGYEMDAWYGVITSRGVPAAIVARLNAEINKGLSNPETKQQFYKQGFTTVGGPAEQFTRLLQVELAKWAKVVKDNNIKPG